MHMGKYLGIDSSTQSISCLVIDADAGRIEAEVSLNFDEILGDKYGVDNGVLQLGEGQVHSPPLMWAEALDLLLAALVRQGVDLAAIEAVAGSGQQHGTVYLNRQAAETLARLDPALALAEQLKGIFSRATAPVWMDTSTSAQCLELEQGVGGRQALLELSGNTAFERFSGPQIRKFWQSEGPAYEDSAYIGLVSSYMASLLAGKLVGVDPGDGSGTNLMDIGTRQWSRRALDACAPGLEDKLLALAPSGRVLGPVAPYFVERYGFSPSCVVLPFSGDNPCSLIGMGLVSPGAVALSLGTSDTLFACMDAPRVSTSGEGALFASPDGSNYMALICFLNGSLAREAVRDEHDLDWDGFTNALAQTAPGNGGALMLPYFDAEIVPKIAGPKVVRQGLDPSAASANVRAVIEAQALSSKLHSRWMGVEFKSLHVTGGASANTEILRIFANVHGCPLHRFDTTNAAALGAALRAYQGHSGRAWSEAVAPFTRPLEGWTIQPDPAATAVYADMLPRYAALEQVHTD
jgi:xylulokinase